MMVCFTATIHKIGINPMVVPPKDVLDAVFAKAGKSRSPIQVRGRLNDVAYTQTLVKYAGKWRLYINGEMLKASGLQVGDPANIEIEYDPSPRSFPMPEQLEKALAENTGLRAAFDGLAPSRQKEILRYLGSLKTEVSITRTVEKVLVQLSAVQ